MAVPSFEVVQPRASSRDQHALRKAALLLSACMAALALIAMSRSSDEEAVGFASTQHEALGCCSCASWCLGAVQCPGLKIISADPAREHAGAAFRGTGNFFGN
eukprot:3221783-Rhodomonas_salina.1